jgi:hypothetical protein
MRRLFVSASALLLAVASCVQIFGIDSAQTGWTGSGGATAPSSSGPSSSSSPSASSSSSASSASSASGSSGGAGSGGCGTVRTVSGTETDTYLGNGAMTPVKPNLTTATITILAGPDFDTFTGVGAANGTFSVSGVPACEYYLTFLDPGATPGVPVYYLTSSDMPDMSLWMAGRKNVVAMKMPTTISVNLTGLDPWNNADGLRLISPNTGINALDLVTATNVHPSNGAITFMGSFDASKWFSPPNLIDASQTDHVFLFQRENNVQSGLTCSVLAKSANIGNFTMVDGTPAMLSATLSALPQTKTTTINWATTKFEALKSAVNPNATVGGHFFSLTAYSGVPSDGATGSNTDLLSFDPPLGADLMNLTLAFGDPYSGAMNIAEVVTTYEIPVAAPTATPTNYVVQALYHADQVTFEAQLPMAPFVSPVTNILVDGKSALAGGMLASTTPTVSFSMPATGMPTHFTVRASVLTKTASGGTASNEVGEIWSKLTSIQLPKGMLTSGQTYVFRIDAIEYPGSPADAEAEPRWEPFPQAYAQALVGPFTAP